MDHEVGYAKAHFLQKRTSKSNTQKMPNMQQTRPSRTLVRGMPTLGDESALHSQTQSSNEETSQVSADSAAWNVLWYC